MPKAVIEKLEDVAEGLRGEYELDGEVYVLKVEGFDDHPNVKGLKSAHEKQKTDRRQAVKDVKVMKEKYGRLPEDFDVDDYLDSLDDDDDGEDKKKRNADALQKQKDKLNAKHKRELDTKSGENTKYKSALEKTLKTKGLAAALAEANVRPALLAAATALLTDRVKITELDDDEFGAVVEHDGEDMDIAKFVKIWAKTDEGKEFVSAKQNSGGGANEKGNGSDTGANPFAPKTRNLTAQVILKKKDPAEYDRLKAEAAAASD